LTSIEYNDTVFSYMKNFKGGRLAGKRDSKVAGKGGFGGSKTGGFKSPRRYGYFNGNKPQVISQTAVCDTCGVSCQINFVPKEGKPIYCKECLVGTPYDQSKNIARQAEKDKPVVEAPGEVVDSGAVTQ
jgi:CxxC-x17-CxxC domain-containing protein